MVTASLVVVLRHHKVLLATLMQTAGRAIVPPRLGTGQQTGGATLRKVVIGMDASR